MPRFPSTLRFSARAKWRAWLKKHHASDKGVWLIFYKKHTGKPGLVYTDAVEEALCFGWIDGQLRRIDGQRHMLRFTPRRPGSVWALSNIKRVNKLIRQKNMTRAGLAVYRKADISRQTAPNTTKPKSLTVPRDLRLALQKNAKARLHFRGYPPSFRLTAIWWVRSAKQAETRQRRIRNIVSNAAKHSRPTY